MRPGARPGPCPQIPPRRLPFGAEPTPDGVHFRAWAPAASTLDIVLERDKRVLALEPEAGGWFSGSARGLAAGALYRLRADGGRPVPDPASRFQPDGPHGPSQVVDPSAFAWTDAAWRGATLPGQVLYELHVGTFTREGTFAAAARELPRLADVGITCVELMPLADYPGRFGWGYDGVNLFAPCRNYGTPDDVRRFVDRAHALGLAVILDVVYNHFGPDGNYVPGLAPPIVSRRHTTDWGDAINFDDEGSGPVRSFFVANAGYWVEEFHFDGLRLDATQDIHDDSGTHIVADIGRRVREAARGRETIVLAENEPQDARLARPEAQGGLGLDGLWNDDFHHAAVVALTGRSTAYYTDYRGAPQEFVSALKWGYLYQGQRYAWQKKRRGAPAWGLPASSFVSYVENHDQVSNCGLGKRVRALSNPGSYRAVMAVLLLGPGTPLLFQGQEYGATTPFRFFADHGPELAPLVAKGRREFLAQFPETATMLERVPDPHDPATFESCRLDPAEREQNGDFTRMVRDLLRLRREEKAFREQDRDHFDGAVLGEHAFVLRYFQRDGDRLLVVNLGRDLDLVPAPEPLLAPPAGARWAVLWSSEDPGYGGGGTSDVEREDDGWRLPGRSAVVLHPVPRPVAARADAARGVGEGA